MTSHLGNPDSAFMSELRSYFLGHAFPGNHLRQVSPGFLLPNTRFIHSQSWQCLVSAYTLTCVPLLSVSVRKRLISQFQESKSGSFSFRWGALYPETKIHIKRIKPLSGKEMEFHGRKGVSLDTEGTQCSHFSLCLAGAQWWMVTIQKLQGLKRPFLIWPEKE